MSFIYPPNRELFDEGVLVLHDYNQQIRTELFGLLRTQGGKIVLPCYYKSILSFKNGFARAIDLAGRLVYVSDTGEQLFDPELPFVQELCDDFDEDGKAQIACLVNPAYVATGTMNQDGEMFLRGYNEV